MKRNLIRMSTKPNVTRSREEACKILADLGMKEPPFDPRRIADTLGLEIIYSKFPNDKNVSGYIRKNGIQIVVNSELSSNRQFFTISHELGHKVLHPEYVTSPKYEVLRRDNTYHQGKPIREIEADIFASHLMIPFFALKHYMKLATIEEMTKLFMVSKDALTNQLYWLRTTGNG